MFTAAPAPAPEDALAADAAGERSARHGRVLAELAEIGMDLARLVRRKALDEAEAAARGEASAGAGAVDPGLAFTRIARAVRLTLALEDRLAGARRVQVEQEMAEATARREAEETGRRERIGRVKGKVREVVGEAIEAEAPEDEDEVERLFDALDTLLSEAGHAPGLEDRVVGEWVASLCRELGLEPDWSLWAGERWAISEAKAEAAGSPYASAGWRVGEGERALVCGGALGNGALGAAALGRPP